MRKYLLHSSLFRQILFSLMLFSSLASYSLIAKETASYDTLFEESVAACEAKAWKKAIPLLHKLIDSHTEFEAESHFYLGVCEYEVKEYSHALNAFNEYLTKRKDSKFFMEALAYKYDIAELLRNGASVRLWGIKQLPKWSSGSETALDIYDELIMTLPSHDLAACSLYAKAQLLASQHHFREAIDTYQFFMRRFSDHELTPACYGSLVHLYLEQARSEGVSSELLASAEVALEKFSMRYPHDGRLNDLQNDLQALRECHGRYIYHFGSFYERTGHPQAALLYYKSCASRYPDSNIGRVCAQRIKQLESTLAACRNQRVNKVLMKG